MKPFHFLSMAGAILSSAQRFASTMGSLVAGQTLNSGIKPNHMKNKRFISGLLLGLLFCLLWTSAQAAGPLWTMVPAPGSNPSQTVPVNGSVSIQYIVQNQSHKPKQLVIQSLPGISQTAPCQLAPPRPGRQQLYFEPDDSRQCFACRWDSRRTCALPGQS